MAFPDLVNFPEELSLYTPFVSGLGIDPVVYSAAYPSTTTPLSWPTDSFLYLTLRDNNYFAAFNHPATGWVKKFNITSNPAIANIASNLNTMRSYLSGFSTGIIPPKSMAGFPPPARAIQKIFSINATLTSVSSTNVTSTFGLIQNLSATNITGVNAFITDLSATNITGVNAFVTELSATNITGVNAFVTDLSATNITGVNAFVTELSATNITGVNAFVTDLSATNITAVSISGTNALFDNLTSINLSSTSLTTTTLCATADIYVNDLHILGTCFGCGGGSGGSGTMNQFVYLSAQSANIDSLTAVDIFTTYLSAQSANIDSLTAIDVFTTYLSAQSANIDSLTAIDVIADTLTAENLTLINRHLDIPALRATQFGDQPVAIFFDVTGHEEKNFKLIAAGGVDIPGVAGEAFTFFINGLDELHVVGSNIHGQLGIAGDPIQHITKTPYEFNLIATKGAHSVAISATDTVFTWGFNNNGQLGNGTTTNASTPQLLFDLNQRIVDVSAGGETTAVVSEVGDLYIWGSNSNGQIGIGIDGATFPFADTPVLITDPFGVTKVALGGRHVLALRSDGSIIGWGANDHGQLGNNSAVDELSPILVDNTRTYIKISAGISHSAAIDSSGALFVWGSNGFGELGIGNTNDSLVPVQVTGTFKDVSCGFYHTVAINSADELVAWGRNHKNQIDSTSSISFSTPQTVDTRHYLSCYGGKDCTIGIANDGSVYGIGDNENHQLNAVGLSLPSLGVVSKGELSAINVAMIIDGAADRPGFVGINTDTPNTHLTVRGNISASETIFGNISAPTALIDNLTSNNSILLQANISTANVSTADLSTANITAANIILSNTETANITSASIANLTALNLSAASITANSITFSLFAASFDTLSTRELTCANLGTFENNVTIVNDLSVGGNIRGKFAGTLDVNSLNVDNLTSTFVTTTSTLAVNCSISAVTASNANFGVSGNSTLSGNLSVLNDLLVLGDVSQFESKVIVNSSLRISNPHTETCLVVNQSGGLPVAEFYYTHAPFESTNIALFIGGYAFTGDIPVSKYNAGFVGVKTDNPNKELTVKGSISASKDILTETGNIKSLSVTAASGFFTDHLFAPSITLPGDITANSISSQTLNVAVSADIETILSNAITATDIKVLDSLSAANTITANLFKGKVSTSDINVTNITGVNCTLSSVSSHLIVADSATFGALTSTSAKFTDVIATNLTSISVSATNVSAVSGFFDDIAVRNSGSFGINLSVGNNLNVGNDLTVTNKTLATDIEALRDVTVGRSLTVINDILVNHDISAKNDIFVTNEVHARRFIGEVIGPTVSIGTSVDLISLSAQSGHINHLLTEELSATSITAISAFLDFIDDVIIGNATATSLSTTSLTALTADIAFQPSISANVGFVQNLTSQSISATDVLFDNAVVQNLTSVNAKINDINAEQIKVLNDNVATNLIIKQGSDINILEAYYNSLCSPLTSWHPALVIKGGSCTSLTKGFVGINTDTPNVQLTVVGNISADGDIIASGNATIAGDVNTAGTVFAGNDVTAAAALFVAGDVGINTLAPRSNLDVVGKIWTVNLDVSNTIDTITINATQGNITTLMAGDITTTTAHVLTDLTVDGQIFGNVVGSFTSTGTTIVDALSTASLTADNATITTLSATTIIVPGGSSAVWNKAYNVPITINMVIDGGGQSIQEGVKSFIELPYDMILNSWSIYSDIPSTNAVAVSVLSADFSTYPASLPIHGNAPTLSPGNVKDSSSDLSTWSTALLSGTVLTFGVSTVQIAGAPATIESTLITLCLRGMRS